MNQPISAPRPQDAELSPASSSTGPTTTASNNHSADLAERVSRLEAMLRQQNTHSSAPPWLGDLNQIDEPVSPPTSFDHRGLARSSRDLDGILHVDENGYVRFIAGSPQWQSSRLASIDVSAGVSGSIARFPVHSINTTSMEELVSALPSRRHCAELVQIYFQSYASLFHVRKYKMTILFSRSAAKWVHSLWLLACSMTAPERRTCLSHLSTDVFASTRSHFPASI